MEAERSVGGAGTSPRALFRQAVHAQSGSFEPSALFEWFQRHAPWVDLLLIDGLLVSGTANDRRRRHFPGPEDVLFGRSDGTYERFQPARHGRWTKAGTPEKVVALLGRLQERERQVRQTHASSRRAG